MLNVTEIARNKILHTLSQNNKSYFRISVDGGGCKGFVYNYSMDNGLNHDDELIDNLILVDSISKPFLNGSTLDFASSLMKKEFKIHNPNFTKSCGCNKSFS